MCCSFAEQEVEGEAGEQGENEIHSHLACVPSYECGWKTRDYQELTGSISRALRGDFPLGMECQEIA